MIRKQDRSFVLKNRKIYVFFMILCLILVTGCQGKKLMRQTDRNNNTEQTELKDDKEIDQALKEYRAAREEGMKGIKIGGAIMVTGPEGEKYGLPEADVEYNTLDTKEVAEAFQTAQDYVDQTLKLDSEVRECADPRILQIYDDEDKGVAKGYDKDDIYVLEYEEKDKTWSYLFLGKKGKGKPWKVLAHGKNYK